MFIKKRPLRFIFVFISLVGILTLFVVRLAFIQIFHASYLNRLAEKQHNYFVCLEPDRGRILDDHKRPLAINVTAYSLYGQPRQMSRLDKKRAVRELSRLLPVKKDFLEERLSRDKDFIWLARKLSFQEADAIRALHIRGLGFIKETKRYYPNGPLAAHVVGFAGTDNKGLEGLELKYDPYLKGKPGWAQILRDAHQKQLLIENKFVPPKDGFDIVLTLDATIQFLAERALDKAYRKHHAKGASLIIMNPRTGEILAMANRPTFDLSHVSQSTADERRNRAINDMYEPGSVFKIVTAAAALEEEKFDEGDKIFCENGSYRVGPHILHDHRAHGMLTFSEVFEQSSNIGVTKIAQSLGPEIIYKYAKLFGFGKPTGVDLVGEVGGVLKLPSQWSKTSIGAIPIGQEVTVNALQILCAMSAIANDGIYMAPHVVKYIKDKEGEIIQEFPSREVRRVISKNTALRLKKILEGVVERGTGRLARIPSVKVAGKTGTAQKVINGRYSHSKFYATFVGFAPVEDPRIAMIVVFDEPHPSHYGGTVAAPVFKEVASEVLKYLETEEE